MGFLNALRKNDRKFWFVCNGRMQEKANDALQSIFYYHGAPVEKLDRALAVCPRRQNTDTVSIRKLKDAGCEAQLWGLEQIVRQHPRAFFEVKPEGMKAAD